MYNLTIKDWYEQRYKQTKGCPGWKETNQQMACRTIGQRSCNRIKVVYQHHTAECRDIGGDCQIFECWDTGFVLADREYSSQGWIDNKMEQNKKDLLFEHRNKLDEVISTLSANFSQKEVAD